MFPTDSIYGVHDRDGAYLIVEAGREGWVVIAEAIGHNDPDIVTGGQYLHLAEQGLVAMVRLNNGWNPDGTIPEHEYVPAFSVKAGRFAAASVGCSHWIIANETNHQQEWPHGQPITPADYAACFVACQREIKARAGAEHQVIVGAVAPWNVDTGYPGNESGDWLVYFQDVLRLIEERGGTVDGITLHTYTHGTDPALVTSEATMDAPYTDRRFHFRAYQDFMHAIPDHLQDVPVYITETDPDVEWADVNSGWVQAAYREIDEWNADPERQTIWCLALFRSAHCDTWHWLDKAGVVADFKVALAEGYERPEARPEEDNVTGFDGTFTGAVREVDGISALKVIRPWVPWWNKEETRPEFTSNVEHALSGHGQCQKVFHVFTTWEGGIYQVAEAQPGQRLRVWFQVKMGSGTKDNPDRKGNGRTWIGIDPFGGTDLTSASVVWSEVMDRVYDEWTLIEVEAVALANQVTIFTRTTWEWAVGWNDVFFGEADLEVIEDTPSPTPTPTPVPSGDHTVTVLLNGQQVVDAPFAVEIQGISFFPVASATSYASETQLEIVDDWPFDMLPPWDEVPAWLRWLIRQVFWRHRY